ncbi:hypothetical protein KO500_02510 [Cellulophaga baltica]|uniref:hypothetical protein n=1 Tax=Cellulophaga TaxID=104264 RepID=UPI001C06F0C5|nr:MULTISPECIES: hypothetical protein [Cellulophaga]MBU2995282.1 hypothetical protein [Cellulophaga baltica]MDO6766677.1 hypothetical protein [Cellulophaga sp. 1_MG-2023]
MDDINTIYYNEFGIAFQWTKNSEKDSKKIQLVFKDTGVYVTKNELELFSIIIENTLDSLCVCDGCQHKDSCKSYLLQTPFGQISFAMTLKELKDVEDLITGTIFQLRLDNMLENQSIDLN